MKNLVWKFDTNKKNGELALLENLCSDQTFDQISQCLPDGVYTTFRTYYHTYALCLDDHFQRLEHSARLVDCPIRLECTRLRNILRQVINHFPEQGDLRLRLTIDLKEIPGMLYISAGHLLTPPAEAYQKGVRIVTWDLQRQIALAKRTDFIHKAQQVRAFLPVDVHEALMVTPNGRLLEGLSSNFFALLGGVLYTAREDVLHGITRALTLKAAQRIRLPLCLLAISMKNLPQIEEAFITSASRGILPVRQIDDTLLPCKTPGEITCRLMTAFEELLQAELEPI